VFSVESMGVEHSERASSASETMSPTAIGKRHRSDGSG
jgi:hypothetical protein